MSRPTGQDAIDFLREWDGARGNLPAKAKLGLKYHAKDRTMRGWAECARKEQVNISDVKYTPYPDFKVKPFKVGHPRRDEEDMGIVFADRHDGRITESYNPEICQARTDYLLESAMTIINLHRPIRKVWVFNIGDNLQGENPYQGSKVDTVYQNAREQINNEVKLQGSFLVSLSQGVEEVHFVGVRGNHGRYDKVSPDGTNWDLFLYDHLKLSLQNQKNIKINYSDRFYALVNIRGFRFFLIHGDQVHAVMGVPLFALRRKMQEWYAHVGGFHYGYVGHFHTEEKDMVNSVADYTVCPPLVTGDEWALEKIGRSSHPQQLCFGVHNKYGRTFTYTLHTDRKFLPKPYDEPEGWVQ